ncbi:MAG: acetate--CoA ligase family protein [Hyphomicrobiaceae bacterium]|nr:acetate--CoA ligase family protein [Hyphomicrobiaceae bacterium]
MQDRLERLRSTKATIERLRAHNATGLDEHAAKALLGLFGVGVPRSDITSGAAEGAIKATGLRPPLVVKALCTAPVHKSEVGAVRLGITHAGDVSAAVLAIESSWPETYPPLEGYLIEEMVPADHELIIGGLVDRQFGPLVMVGLGGIFAEVLSDVALRVCPIGPDEARTMLRSLKAYPLLSGARGTRPISEDEVIRALVCIGGERGLLMTLQGEIAELDINPLRVTSDAAVAADARIVLARVTTPAKAQEPVEPPPAMPSFDRLLEPRTVAVAGVSTTGAGAGNRYIENLKALGFPGAIYPIHPTAKRVAGLQAYPTLADTPAPVDYAYVSVPRRGIADLLSGANGRVAFAQIMTSGFAETGDGAEAQMALVAAARKGGVRFLGPNTLGTYSPRGRITMTRPVPAEEGCIGVVSQSGGIAVDLIRQGGTRGLRFRAVVNVGNGADVGPIDLLRHFIDDSGTRVIGVYLEDIADGRTLFRLLAECRGVKPVVLMKGGRTAEGGRAAASHTGSLAADDRVWRAVAEQTGTHLVDTVEDMIGLLLCLQTLTRRTTSATRRLVLIGNGGGASVMGADCFAREGFSLAEWREETRVTLESLGLTDGSSIENPIDIPANVLSKSNGEVMGPLLEALAADGGVDAVAVHLNLPVVLSYRQHDMLGRTLAAMTAARKARPDGPHLVLVLRADGSAEIEAARAPARTRAVAAGIATFDDFAAAARALGHFARHEAAMLASSPDVRELRAET